MSAIIFYVSGTVSLIFALSALAILIGVSDMDKHSMGISIAVSLAFACLAWWAAAGEAE